MKTLIVGGTGFLGGAITDAAKVAGHTVTVFTRGHADRMIPSGVERLAGDRHRDLSALRGRSFDVVVDTCAFSPDAVAALLDAIPPSARYVLVSSVSVYADFSRPGIDEAAVTSRATEAQLAFARDLAIDRRSSADSYDAAYGALKREAELVALARLGQQALILRSGLLVGAGDYTDRLTYWVRRIDRGGTVLVPGRPDRPVQLIDVRDAARFAVASVEQGLGGVFNLTGRPLPVGDLFETCREAAGGEARFVWIKEETLLAAGLQPWSEVPLWLPDSDATYRHFLEISADKVFAAGLLVRSLRETVRDILAWDRTRRAIALKAGIPAEKEARLLSAA